MATSESLNGHAFVHVVNEINGIMVTRARYFGKGSRGLIFQNNMICKIFEEELTVSLFVLIL